MAGFTFKGGIHPYEGKELSKDKPIKRHIPEGIMVYPLSQHIGAPAKPVVKKGDRVLAGQLIAEAGGFVSANIYSSVSGTVKSIEKHRVAVGDMVESIIIENDGQFEAAPPLPVDDIENMTKQDVIDAIKLAGIVGMGGAGFPTHVKLSPKDPDKIYYCIVNCSECEPYLTSDYRRVLEEPEKLVAGLKIILCLFDHAEGIIAVEDNKPDCIKVLKELCFNEPRITVKALKTKYPQGAERQLIYATTKRAISSSMLPADAGCTVNNVDTVVSIYHAIIEKRPLTERIVTVTGDAIAEPGNFLVPTGTSMQQLIDDDLPVTFEYVSRDDVPDGVDLNRLPDDASETIRLVRIGDYDVCPCIGKHVRSTSQIGRFEMLGTNWDEKERSFRVRFKIV